jgi:hypothetical protein
MSFWAIEARPGERLVDEAVSRIVGITTVEALFLFTSRMDPDGFMKGFLADSDGSGSRQELEAAFEHELQVAGVTAEGADLRYPSSPWSPSSR